MSFTTSQLIQSRIGADHWNVLEEDADALQQAIAEADRVITSRTGVEPKSSAIENDKLLVGLASDIVIYILSGRQTAVSEEETERRRQRYEDALATLESIRNGDIRLEQAASITAPAFGAQARRIGDY